MRCEQYRELIVSQLCGEIEKERESELVSHLEQCDGCRQAQTEFGGIIGLMRQLPEREWNETLRIRDLLRQNQRWRTIVFSKAAIWLTAIALAITSISFLPVRWEVSSHGASIRWGHEPSEDKQLQRQLKELQLQLATIQHQNDEWRQASEIHVKQLMDQNNVEQQQRYWQTLQLFTNYVQLQRKADVQKLQHEIATSYDRTGQEVEKTNELLDYVMRASLTDSVGK
jgi:hypothetical protein